MTVRELKDWLTNLTDEGYANYQIVSSISLTHHPLNYLKIDHTKETISFDYSKKTEELLRS